MASQPSTIPKAGLTATKPRTSNQVAAEPEAGFPGAEALSGGQGDLRAGGFLGTFLPEKSTRRIYVIHLIN
jgi:hypothetical protein